jgi:hypothetical protein
MGLLFRFRLAEAPTGGPPLQTAEATVAIEELRPSTTPFSAGVNMLRCGITVRKLQSTRFARLLRKTFSARRFGHN